MRSFKEHYTTKTICYILICTFVFTFSVPPHTVVHANVVDSQIIEDIQPDNNSKAKFAKGRFIVKFKSTDKIFEEPTKGTHTTSAVRNFQRLNTKHKVRAFKKLQTLDNAELKIQKKLLKVKRGLMSTKEALDPNVQEDSKEDLSNTYIVEVPEDGDIESIVEEYSNDPNVEFAQPDYEMSLNVTMNDPYYALTWGLDKIQSEQAWDINQGAGVIVGIVDTGIDFSHEDIAANKWTNAGEIAGNGIDDDGNGYIDDINGWDFVEADNDPWDGHSHGTHVAGTVAAVGNNNIGVVGVAPQAKLMALKGLSDTGSGWSSDLAAGIEYGAMNGADVINNSWGCSSACPSNPVVENAVRTAHALGVVIVFAAGNSTSDTVLRSPNNMQETITVAASDSSDNLASFSNFGSEVDVAAPGVSVLSTVPGNGYSYFNGTSMASPHVAGLAALIISNNPGFTNEEVRNVIRSSADDIKDAGFDIVSGHGRINAFKALQINNPIHVEIEAPLHDAIIDLNSDFELVNGIVSGTNLDEYTIEYKPADHSEDWTIASGPFSAEVISDLLGDIPLNNMGAGDYFFKVSATSLSGNTFEDVIQVINDGSPKIFSPVPDSTVSTEDVTFEWRAGTGVTNYWLYVGSNQLGTDIFSQDMGVSTSAAVTGIPLNGQTLYVSLSYSAGGILYSDEYEYSRISVPIAPVAEDQNVSVLINNPQDINLVATDINDDTLTFTIMSNPSMGTLTTSGSLSPMVTYTPSNGFTGQDSFTFKANDGLADSNIATVSITVDAPPAEAPVVWTEEIGVTVSGNTITRFTTDGGWVEGARSTGTVIADGGMNFRANNTSTYRMAGLASVNTSVHFNVINYAIYVGPSGSLQVYESGVSRGSFGSYAAGDRMSVERVGTMVSYKKNDVTFYTSTVASNGPLIVDASIYSGSIEDAYILNTISGPNNAPVADDQEVSVQYETETTINLVASDDDNDLLTYIIVDSPNNGSITGTLGEQVTFLPNNGFSGDDSFTFRVNDGEEDSNVATVNITVEELAVEAPVVWTEVIGVSVNGNTITRFTTDGGWIEGARSAGVINADGGMNFRASNTSTYRMAGLASVNTSVHFNVIDYAIYVGPNGSLVVYESGVSRGSFGNYAAGDRMSVERVGTTVSYKKNDVTFYTSTVASSGPLIVDASIYSGSIEDANILNFSSAENSAPVAVDQDVSVPKDVPKVITLEATDVNDDSISYILESMPVNGGLLDNTGSISAPGPLNGSSLTYVPNAFFEGADSFNFKANDGELDSNVATISLAVSEDGNHTPIADNQGVITTEDEAVSITLTGSDSDGDSLTFIVETQPSNGALSGTAPDLTFTPDNGFTGSDSFTFKVNDGEEDSELATVSINVNASTNELVTWKDLVSMEIEGNMLRRKYLASPPFLKLAGAASNQVLRGDFTIEHVVYSAEEHAKFGVSYHNVDSGNFGIDWSFQTFMDSSGTGTASVVEGNYQGLAQVNISAGDMVSITRTGNTIYYKVNGSVIYTSALSSNGDLLVDAHIPGSGMGDVNVLTEVYITHNSLNMPWAHDLNTETRVSAPINLNLTAQDPNGDSLTYELVSSPSYGSLSGILPNVTYSPNAGYKGEDSFQFRVNDGSINSANAKVSIAVNDFEGELIWKNGEDIAVNGNTISTTSTDVNGWTNTSGAQSVNTLYGDGGIEFTVTTETYNRNITVGLVAANTKINHQYYGMDYGVKFYTYDSPDGIEMKEHDYQEWECGNCENPDVNVGDRVSIERIGTTIHYKLNGEIYYTSKKPSITPLVADINFGSIGTYLEDVRFIDYNNITPVADDQSHVSAVNTSVPFTLTASDADLEPLTITVVTQPVNGTLSGTVPNLTYTPNNDFQGTDSFTFKANDGNVDSNIATIDFVVRTYVALEPITWIEPVQMTVNGNSVTGQGVGGTPQLPVRPKARSQQILTGDGYVDFLIDDVHDDRYFSLDVENYDGTQIPAYQIITCNRLCDKQFRIEAGIYDDSEWMPYEPGDRFSIERVGGKIYFKKNNTTVHVAVITTTEDLVLYGQIWETSTIWDANIVRVGSGNNAFPVAVDQDISTVVDTAVGITLSATDSDGDPLTYSVNTQPLNGNLSGTAPNLTYTPNNGFTGNDSLTFKANDGQGDSNVATVSIIVQPMLGDPVVWTEMNNVSANGNTITKTAPSSMTNGGDAISTQVIYGDGGVNFLVDNHENRRWIGLSNTNEDATQYSIDYAIAMGANGGDPEFYVYENGTNKYTGEEYEIDDRFQIMREGSTIYYKRNGTTFYTSTVQNTDNFIVDTFIYNQGGTINDVHVTSGSAPTNNPPVAQDQNVETNQDTTLPLTLVATDEDGDSLTFNVETQPSNGVISGTLPDLTYTPNNGFTGNDSFTFVANDGTEDSAEATVTIVISPAAVLEPIVWDNIIVGAVANGNTLTKTLNSNSANAGAGTSNVLNGNGGISVVLDQEPRQSEIFGLTGTNPFNPTNNYLAYNFEFNTNKTFSACHSQGCFYTGNYIPGDEFVIERIGDTVYYKKNGVVVYVPTMKWNGPLIGGAILRKSNSMITANMFGDSSIPDNTPPVADGQEIDVEYETPIAITLTGSDADGDALTFNIVSQPVRGTITGTAPNLIYTPMADYSGTDDIMFTVNDGTEDSEMVGILIDILDPNWAPVAQDQNVETDQDTTLPLTLVATDGNGDSLTYGLASAPSNGNISTTGDSATDFSYIPNEGFSGEDSFTFFAYDGQANSNNATVSITVSSVNTAPRANNINYYTAEGTTLNITLTGSDADGDDLTFMVLSNPSNGTLSGTLGPDITYTPDDGFFGVDSFTYIANDGQENSAPATVSITLSSTNTAPVANDEDFYVAGNNLLDITLVGSDDDEDSLSYIIIDNPSHGALSGTGADVIYTPNNGFTGSDSFTFKINDSEEDSNTATVSLEVIEAIIWTDVVGMNVDGASITKTAETGSGNAGAASAQVISEDGGVYIMAEPLTVPGFIGLSDSNPDNNYQSIKYAFYFHNGGQVKIWDNGVQYDPFEFGFQYDASDQFRIIRTGTTIRYYVNDFLYMTSPNPSNTDLIVDYSAYHNGATIKNVAISGGAVSSNTPPISDNQNVEVDENSSVDITVTGSDVDGDSMTYNIVDLPIRGVLSGTAPNVTYIPNNNFDGQDSFTFKANDGSTDSNTATISLTVNNVNSAPVSDSQSVSTEEGVDKAITLGATDMDGDTLTFSIMSQPSNGVLSGTLPNIMYTPNNGYSGQDSFTFKTNDGEDDSNEAMVSVMVTAVLTESPIIWTEVVGVNVSDNTITRIDEHGGWSAGARSERVIDADGGMNFRVNNTYTYRMAGLATANTSTHFNVIDYAIYLSVGGGLHIYESGVHKGSFAQGYNVGDRMSVERSGTTVEYKKNGVTFYTSTVASSGSLIADTSVYSGSIEDANIMGATAAPNNAPVSEDQSISTEEDVAKAITLGATDEDGDSLTYSIVGQPSSGTLSGTLPNIIYTPNNGFSGQDSFTFKTNDGEDDSNIAMISIEITEVLTEAPVVWVGATGVNVNGNTITRVDNNGGWSAGARSSAVVSADGGMNFRASDTNSYRMVGLATVNTSMHFNVIDYAIYLSVGGGLHVYENGVHRGNMGSYTTGDRMSVERVGTTVSYKKNDVTFYTSTVASSGSLMVDTSVYSGSIADANIVGAGAAPNSAPVSDSQSVSTEEGVDKAITLGATDMDGDTLTFSIMSQPSNGVLSGTLPNIMYTPNNGYSGQDSFTFKTNDGEDDSNEAMVSVMVTAVLTESPIIWTEVVGVNVSDNTITRIDEHGGWSAGARSERVIDADGGMNFRVNNTYTYRMAGLATANTSTHFNVIDYAIYLSVGGGLHIYESGVHKGSFAQGYNVGDRMSVERSGTTVEYKKNGVTFYTSTVASSGSLIADTSVYSGSIEDANILSD